MVQNTSLTITSVPSDVGSVIRGKSAAPEAILDSTNLRSDLENLGYTIKEQNALQSEPKVWQSSPIGPSGVRNEQANVEVLQKVKVAISTALQSESTRAPFQLVLGGECCMLPAIMSAFWHHHEQQGKKVGLVYIDGDCDLDLPGDSGISGNLASMTMSHLMLRDGALESMKDFSRVDGKGVVDSSNTVLFGLNIDVASARREHFGYLFDEGYRVITSRAVAWDPVGRAREAIRWLVDVKRVDVVVVHLDVDAIDAGEFPLSNIPNYTGTSLGAIMTTVKEFLSCDKVEGLVLAEVNPDHDADLNMTNRLVEGLVEAFKKRLDKA